MPLKLLEAMQSSVYLLPNQVAVPLLAGKNDGDDEGEGDAVSVCSMRS